MADLNIIICPGCGHEIPLSEAFSHQIEEKLKAEFDSKLKKLEQDKKKLAADIDQKLKEKEEELTEKSRQYLLEQKKKMEQEVIEKMKKQNDLEIEDLKKQNEENLAKLENAQKLELELRSERRKLEEEKKNQEIEMIRRMDEERQKLSEKIQSELQLKFELEKREQEKKLSDMQKALEDAQRKASATSERFRGEVFELDLEDGIRSAFNYDFIEEVPKGILGADVIQVVKDQLGKEYGRIVWECKRTKSFNEDWVTKLKDDLIRAKGNIGIIVTQTLPEDIKTFGQHNGIWISDFNSYLQLAGVLRGQLFEVKRVEKLNEGKDQKMTLVYDYLSSDQFKNKVISIVESFNRMQDQLDKEKRAFTKIWAEREMQIKRMTEGTVSIVGDLQGLMGSSLPKIDGLDVEDVLTLE